MLRNRTIAYLGFALLLGFAIAVPRSAAADGAAIGSSCSSGTYGATGSYNGNNEICVGGTWQYPAYTMQSYSGSAGASCSGYPAGAVHYNTTISNLEFCNGTNWDLIAAGSTSCGTPSGLSFTNLTSQSLGVVATNATPATITFSGCASALSVSVSGTATAQISINGGAWVTSGSINSGQTLNVRMTTSNSVNTTLTATVTIGSTSTNWTTTTRAGSLQAFVTAGTYIGWQIGGLSGADAICQTEAGTAGYAGTYKAIISSDSTSAGSRLTLTYPIIRATDGTTIASTNLWSGTLNNSFSTSGVVVWTGTTPDGSINTGNTCSSWSSSSATGGIGNSVTTTSSDCWNTPFYAACSNGSCTAAYNLYCIQQ